MGTLRVPKKACDTCPYLRETPAGIWSAEEYEKLPTFDHDHEGMPVFATFLCHQTNATKVDTVCRGWLSTHGDSIGARMAIMRKEIDPEDIPPAVEPEYYATGREACDAGLAGLEEPGDEAQVKMSKLLARGAAHFADEEIL